MGGLYAEAAVREHRTRAMPNILNFVAWQEAPRLKRTNQIQQSHSRIYQGQHFHRILLIDLSLLADTRRPRILQSGATISSYSLLIAALPVIQLLYVISMVAVWSITNV